MQAAGLAAAPKLLLSLAELPVRSKYWLGNLSTDVADDVAGVVECSALSRKETVRVTMMAVMMMMMIITILYSSI